VTAGTNRAFTETLLKASVQATYVASGEVPERLYMSPYHKGVFSAFTGIAANRVDLGKKTTQGTIVAGADLYVSDFGTIEIVPHYLMAGSTDVFGLNAEYGDAVYLRGFESTPLGKTGDNEKVQVLADATFRLTSEMAQMKISNLTPA
jgi:translation elongation factor EF-G